MSSKIWILVEEGRAFEAKSLSIEQINTKNKAVQFVEETVMQQYVKFVKM